MMTPKERARQDQFNEYVSWRLELIHSNPDIDLLEISDFEEWIGGVTIVESIKKPKIKKRRPDGKKKKQTA